MKKLISSIISSSVTYISIIFVITIFSFYPVSSSPNNPIETIKELHNGLLKLKTIESNSNQFQTINIIIEKVYDSKKMIRMIIGDVWKNLNDTEKEKIHKTFQDYIVYNYIKRFKKIGKFDFEYKAINPIGKSFRLVKTILIIENEGFVEIDYLLHNRDDEWKIFDVLLKGSISEIATRKSEFKKPILDGGIELLIKSINEKNNLN